MLGILNRRSAPSLDGGAAAWGLPLLALLALVEGCLDNPGVDPPEGALNFPIAAALSPSDGVTPSAHIFVANANFDLRYNSGTLQAFDLDAYARCAAEECVPGAANELDPTEGIFTSPSGCTTRCPGLFVSEVRVGSFADGLAISGDGSRLYLAARSDASLSYVDVGAGGSLSCGGAGLECDAAHLRAGEGVSTLRDLELPADPVGLHVGPVSEIGGPTDGGEYVLMVHRQGEASLFLDGPVAGADRPRLVHVLRDLPVELVTLSRHPETGRFWAPSAWEPAIARIGVAFDAAVAEASFLFDAGDATVSGIDPGISGRGDVREIRFDARPDHRGQAYLLSRRPQALMFARDVDGTRLRIDEIVEVGGGPARMEIVEFAAMGRTLAFVSCFDTQDVYIVDVDLGRLLSVVRAMSGPFELLVDVPRERFYVIDFRASVVRAFDLAPFFACLGGGSGECAPTPLGSIGAPRPVVELL